MWKYALLLGAVVAQPALADEGNAGESTISGLRIELRVGYETPTISEGNVYKIGSSVSIGGEVGYDAAVSKKMTVGPYANYEYANSETCVSGYCLGSDGNWQAGLRVGIALSGKSQLYVKGGYDSFQLKGSVNGVSNTETLNGPQGAIGLAFNLSRRSYAGVELGYADLGSYAGYNFQRRHAGVVLGIRM